MAALTDGKEMSVGATYVGDVTLSYKAFLAVGASNRHVSVACPNVKAGDSLSFRPINGFPDGYNIGAPYCLTDGTITVPVSHPALVLNQQFDITGKVYRIMT